MTLLTNTSIQVVLIFERTVHYWEYADYEDRD